MTESPAWDLEILCQNDEPVWLEAYQAYCRAVLGRLGIVKAEVSITLCDDAFIHDLNRRFRGKDEATDVLSFEHQAFAGPMAAPDNPRLLGDLVISLDTLRVNAAYFQVSLEEELRRVTLHGLLHLQGWDHSSTAADEPMLRHQEALLAQLPHRLFEKDER